MNDCLRIYTQLCSAHPNKEWYMTTNWWMKIYAFYLFFPPLSMQQHIVTLSLPPHPIKKKTNLYDKIDYKNPFFYTHFQCFHLSFRLAEGFEFWLVLTSSPYFQVKEALGQCKRDSRGSLGWHLLEMACTSHIPLGSTPMVLKWHGAAPLSPLIRKPQPVVSQHPPLNKASFSCQLNINA